MFDAQCDLAALVYNEHDDPDAVLLDFASDLAARGLRAVGMVQTGQCADSSLSAVLLPGGERLPLAQDFDPAVHGCRLDVARLEHAGARIAAAMAEGADLVVINRFGKRERDGKGLAHLIARALDADIPVIVAVAAARFTDWIRFAEGMSVKLPCNRRAVAAWWGGIALTCPASRPAHRTVCEIAK